MNTAYAVWPWPPLFTILCTCYWLITTHRTYSTTSLLSYQIQCQREKMHVWQYVNMFLSGNRTLNS